MPRRRVSLQIESHPVRADGGLALQSVPPAALRRRGSADRPWVEQPLAVGQVEWYAGTDPDRARPARRLAPRGGGVRVADQPERGALHGQAGARVGCADVLMDGVAGTAVPALDLPAARRGPARAHPLDLGVAEPFPRELDRARRGRPGLTESRGFGRS